MVDPVASVVRAARWPDDRAVVLDLIRDYVASLDGDICFQDVDRELADMPGADARPAGERLVAACADGVAGLVARRTIAPGLCEMKRLYVRPECRAKGLALAVAIVADDTAAGFRQMVLDTLGTMVVARARYQ